MIRIYGMPTCPYCDYVHEQVRGREDEFEYINIGENIRNMSAFMRLRDQSPVFDRMKEIGDVGTPAFKKGPVQHDLPRSFLNRPFAMGSSEERPAVFSASGAGILVAPLGYLHVAAALAHIDPPFTFAYSSKSLYSWSPTWHRAISQPLFMISRTSLPEISAI